jgi:anti-anti-sigma regulatory factor
MVTTETPGHGGKWLWLRTGERLDICDCRRFLRAARMLRGSLLDQVVIDLGATRRVLDSGLGLLLMLHGHAGDKADRIKIVNCGPEVLARLRASGIQPLFDIAASVP